MNAETPPSGTEPTWLAAVRAAAAERVEAARDRWRVRGELTGPHDAIDEITSTPAVRERPTSGPSVDESPPMTYLVRAFELTERDTQWLALLAACHTDPRLNQVLGYLDDNPRPVDPCPASAAGLWGWPLGAQPGPSSALVRWQMAAPAGPDPWSSTTPWSIDPDVAAFLCDAPDWWAFWPGIQRPEQHTGACLHPDLLDELHAVLATAAPTGRPWELELLGMPGSGRRTLLAQLVESLGRHAVILAADLGVRGLRTARLLDAVPIWIADDGDPPINLDERAAALTLVVRQHPGPASSPAAVRLSWTLPAPARADRCRLWASHTSVPAPPHVVDWELTPADIAVAAAAADAGTRVASSVVRRRLRTTSAAAITALDCPYEWSDLVVTDHVADALQRLKNQVQLAGPVLDDWGFGRLCPQSRGVTALFAGPSGTGKTMAAQVLARALDLDLYRVDLAEVVNKYIGETEKRLAQVFAECERSNVMVFFDEADALFGRRTHVRDAHDRFANIEIDYLLQRMDTFTGVAVLATNRKDDLDTAFVRRLKVIVDFVAPSVHERRRLWQLAVPAAMPDGTPVSTDVDYEWLATELEFTGADIKSVALDAAFCARAAGELIDDAHMLAAVQRAMAKRGAVLRAQPPALASTNGRIR